MRLNFGSSLKRGNLEEEIYILMLDPNVLSRLLL